MPDSDLVIVGGGIAGGALGLAMARAGRSVTILEFQDTYRDRVKGEAFCPWGMEEAERLGVADAVHAARPAPLRRWVQWDEIYHPDDAPTVNIQAICQTFVPGVDSAFAIHHYKTCEQLTSRAAEAGADVIFGVRDLVVEKGTAPAVRFTAGGSSHVVRPKLVVGAGGHHGPVGKQVGLALNHSNHHWGGGLAVEGMEEWPAGVQAMGTEGRVMFFVFPQRDGRARLYLNYATEDRHRYAGPEGTKRFLGDFDLKCLPLRDLVISAKPIGRCMTSPSYTSWLDGDPVTDGVVLIGDEAGSNDQVLGTGLASGFRDARIVSEILTSTENWSAPSFAPYAAERRRRMDRLVRTGALVAKLSVEFGPDAIERRRRAWDRIRQNPSYALTQLVMAAGPDRVPDVAFSPLVVQKLLAEEREPSRRQARLGSLVSAAAPEQLAVTGSPA